MSVLVAACADPASPGNTFPVAFFWMEWPAAVTPSAHGTLLRQLYADPCSDLSLGFTVSNQQLIARGTRTWHGQVCPEAIAAIPFDTTMPLPALAAQVGFYEVRANLYSPRGEAFERTAGTIAVQAQADTLRQMAGSATILVDGAGCTVLRGGAQFFPFPGGLVPHEYAIQNPPAFSDTTAVFVRAHQVTGTVAAACGSKRIAHLDYVETVLLP